VKVEYKIKYDATLSKFLWWLGSSKRKKILKFFGKWTLEDELYEILTEEIQNEINKELINMFMKGTNT
jgi:hypothetical protein